MTKHRPDREIVLMLRVLRDLEALPAAGRHRVLAYWCARVETMPPPAGDTADEQQLDIEDIPQMPALRGAAA